MHGYHVVPYVRDCPEFVNCNRKRSFALHHVILIQPAFLLYRPVSSTMRCSGPESVRQEPSPCFPQEIHVLAENDPYDAALIYA